MGTMQSMLVTPSLAQMMAWEHGLQDLAGMQGMLCPWSLLYLLTKNLVSGQG